MQPLRQATASVRGYRAIVPCDGYVHKFRLETCEEAAADRWSTRDITPTVSVGSLVGKFVLCAVALAGIAAAGAHVLV